MRLAILILHGFLAWSAVQAASPPRVIMAHQNHLSAIAFADDGKQIISIGDDGAMKRWDAVTGKLLAEGKINSPLTALVVNSTNGQIITGAWNGCLQIWDKEKVATPPPIKAHAENITALALSTDSHWLATGSGDDTARIWDLKTNKPRLTIEQSNEYDVTCVAFDPAGKWLLTGDGEGTVRIYDTAAGRELQRFSCHAETIAGAVILDNGKKFLTASWDDTIKIWDAVTGAELQSFAGHTDDVTCIALSQDGNTLISGSTDKTVRCWSLATGKSCYTTPVAANPISAVAITADGQKIAYAIGKEVFFQEIR